MTSNQVVDMTAPLACLALALLPSEQSTEIGRLVHQLGSPRFAEWEAASRGLEAISGPAWQMLEQAARAGPDPEVRRRAEGLLAAIVKPKLRATGRMRLPTLRSAGFSPDGQTLVVLEEGARGKVLLCDLHGAPQAKLGGQIGAVNVATFSPDGKMLATGATMGRCGCGTYPGVPSSASCGVLPAWSGGSRSLRTARRSRRAGLFHRFAFGT
jgi:hypothetical protein